MGNEQSSGSGSGGSNDKVKTDKESFGGETMRGWDHTLSEKLGGYKSGQEPGIYGKYVEPTLHAAVHTARGIGNRNFFLSIPYTCDLRVNIFLLRARWLGSPDESSRMGPRQR